jgi:hypothetical protein
MGFGGKAFPNAPSQPFLAASVCTAALTKDEDGPPFDLLGVVVEDGGTSTPRQPAEGSPIPESAPGNLGGQFCKTALAELQLLCLPISPIAGTQPLVTGRPVLASGDAADCGPSPLAKTGPARLGCGFGSPARDEHPMAWLGSPRCNQARTAMPRLIQRAKSQRLGAGKPSRSDPEPIPDSTIAKFMNLSFVERFAELTERHRPGLQADVKTGHQGPPQRAPPGRRGSNERPIGSRRPLAQRLCGTR